VGLGLLASKRAYFKLVGIVARRAGFLLGVGLANMIVFPADILHHYAFYFVICIPFLRADWAVLIGAILILIVGFLGLVFVLEYDAGWDWQTLEYEGLWTLEGFFRATFFNGWHPAVPWTAFVLFGMLLARMPLQRLNVQLALLLVGGGAAIALQTVSLVLIASASEVDPELGYLFATEPIPPGPIYVMSNMATASLLIGVCLLLESLMCRVRLIGLIAIPGRMALTLYVAHIYLGLACVDALSTVLNTSSFGALLVSFAFCIASILFSMGWTSRFKHGPLEAMMRRLSER